MVPLSFAGQEMRLVQGRALYWPREAALLVADLHLEKGSHFAKAGQFVPPYDSRETLGRLALALRETGARRVFCLGDNFHDDGGAERLEPHAAGMLAALTRATDWVWISGNHDARHDSQPGSAIDELEMSGVHLRHRARPGETAPELSGHFHPRLAVTVRGRRIVRPCAVSSGSRMILPAYGSLTGGMNAAAPEIISAMQPASEIRALAQAGDRLVEYSLWRAAV
jgi:hypothetical protein